MNPEAETLTFKKANSSINTLAEILAGILLIKSLRNEAFFSSFSVILLASSILPGNINYLIGSGRFSAELKVRSISTFLKYSKNCN